MPNVTVQTDSIPGGDEPLPSTSRQVSTLPPPNMNSSSLKSSAVPTPTRNSARIQQRAAGIKIFAPWKKHNTGPSSSRQKLSLAKRFKKKKVPPPRKNSSRKELMIPEHIEIIQGPVGPLYRCTVGKCSSKKEPFKTRTNIKYHKNCANGLAEEIEPSKFLFCPCGDKFRYKETLEYHQTIMSHGPNGEEKPAFEGFSCLLCDIKIKRWDNLRRHLRNLHNTDHERATELADIAKERVLKETPSGTGIKAAFGQECGENDDDVKVLETIKPIKAEKDSVEVEAVGETPSTRGVLLSGPGASQKENNEEGCSVSVADTEEMDEDNDDVGEDGAKLRSIKDAVEGFRCTVM